MKSSSAKQIVVSPATHDKINNFFNRHSSFSCVQKYRGLTAVVVLQSTVNEIDKAFSIRCNCFGYDLNETTVQSNIPTAFDYDIFETFLRRLMRTLTARSDGEGLFCIYGVIRLNIL